MLMLAWCYAIKFVMVLDVTEPIGYQGVTMQMLLAMFIDGKYLFI